MQDLILQSLKFQYYKIFKTLKSSYFNKMVKNHYIDTISREATLCGGRIYSPYVNATVVLARYERNSSQRNLSLLFVISICHVTLYVVCSLLAVWSRVLSM